MFGGTGCFKTAYFWHHQYSDDVAGDIVSEGHFGGGILQKKAGTEAEQEKSWKDRMEEMIAKSKLAKVWNYSNVSAISGTLRSGTTVMSLQLVVLQSMELQ